MKIKAQVLRLLAVGFIFCTKADIIIIFRSSHQRYSVKKVGSIVTEGIRTLLSFSKKFLKRKKQKFNF